MCVAGLRPAVEVMTQRPSMGGIEGFGADDPDFFDNLDDLPPSTPSSPTRLGVFGAAGMEQPGTCATNVRHCDLCGLGGDVSQDLWPAHHKQC